MLNITPAAQEYLAELLAKQEDSATGIRVFVNQPGTPYAESCIAYCRSGEHQPEDVFVQYTGFHAYLDADSLLYLEDAVVDFASDKMGGQLTIKAPKAKTPQISEDSPIEDRINYILQTEINPGLASHGGKVVLIRMEDEGSTAILQFGGGCQGCGMVDLTLKEGVERTLIERIAELKAVRDVTDHSQRDNAYYK